MKVVKWAAPAGALLCLAAVAAQGANVSVDCTKKASINTALGKLDRSVSNTVTIIGTCAENVVVTSHRDLTMVSSGGGIRADLSTIPDAIPLYVQGNSRVTLRGLSVADGGQVVYCDDRSTCVLDGVTVTGGIYGGVSIQKQSSADIIGSTSITGSTGTGLGVYGASSANVGSSVVISGHTDGSGGGVGVGLLDGSFVRFDGGTVTGNDTGVSGDRGTTIKLLGTYVTSNTAGPGIILRASTAQLGNTTISGNNKGVLVRDLSFVAIQGGATSITSNASGNIVCQTATSIVAGPLSCGS